MNLATRTLQAIERGDRQLLERLQAEYRNSGGTIIRDGGTCAVRGSFPDEGTARPRSQFYPGYEPVAPYEPVVAPLVRRAKEPVSRTRTRRPYQRPYWLLRPDEDWRL
jgi:hypothetical protein